MSYVTVKRRKRHQDLNHTFTQYFDFSKNQELYQQWESAGCFKNDPNSSNPLYFLPMPPPNITGELHLGHALFLSIQDCLIRYKKMQGFNTLWQPGLDHAGLATHEKIMKHFKKINHRPSETEYMQFGEQWAAEKSAAITNQIKQTGSACDWEQLIYTMSPSYQKTTNSAFEKIFALGLIYYQDGQWYLNLKEQTDKLIEAIHCKKIKIIPESQTGNLMNFLENFEPWCISRQIKWGQRIPLAQDEQGNIFYSDNPDTKGQIEDRLDTWFCSSLYPLAISGWETNEDRFKKFYPCSLIETGYDILFPWCARMLMMCNLLTGDYPFSEIYLHGLLRDKNGEKFSKSLGNGIDPLLIIKQYGADAMRLGLLSKTSNCNDLCLSQDSFKTSSIFLNKIWNASKFIFKYAEHINLEDIDYQKRCPKMHSIWKKYHENFSEYGFLQNAQMIEHEFKDWFCSTWIEQNKAAFYEGKKENILEGLIILYQFLLMLHPFIPFITEEIFSHYKQDFLYEEKF